MSKRSRRRSVIKRATTARLRRLEARIRFCRVHTLFEEDASVPSIWYSDGHVRPIDLVRLIDMDDLEELLPEEAFNDDGDLKNEAASMASLAKRVKHRHASKDVDGSVSFLAAPHDGSFPATVIDVYS